MSYLSRQQLLTLGLRSLGDNVLISDKASVYNPANISIGSHVRIDDFCVLSAGKGGIIIGSYIHIAVYTLLIGAGRITLSDFTNLSSRVSVYSSSDDYSGESMTSPMIPDSYKQVIDDDVYFGRHVIVGSGSVILPGSILEEGVAIGALSLVKSSCSAFGVYGGNPASRIKERSRKLLQVEHDFARDKNIDLS